MPEEHGFFYHFTDIETGVRWRRSEVSPIDTSLLLCGVLTAREHFSDARIKSLAQQIYERVDWPWMLNDGGAFAMAWGPEQGFHKGRWDHYCELMMMYLLAIGSRPIRFRRIPGTTSRVRSSSTRDGVHQNGAPLFVHQYSHAYYDFRHKRDAYADYFENSVIATRAHKEFCLSHPEWYNEDYWGVSASDSQHGYHAWGDRLRRGRSMARWFPVPQPARCHSCPPIASPCCVPCAQSGATGPGAATVSSTPSIRRRTGTIQMCWESIREFQY